MRSFVGEIYSLIKDKNSHLFVANINGNIAACICVEEKNGEAYIGTFAVNPAFQNKGIGKKVLSLAEKYAIKELGLRKLKMVVISQREELISFYERRGYKRTGEVSKYPVHLNVGIPTIEGLTTVEELEKYT